jgi:1,4-alpha-glucan branching enzyme
MATTTQTTVPARELERLFAREHPDPHAVLGAHPSARGVTVRVLRPDAARVELIDDAGASRAMSLTDRRGLYELLVEDRSQVFPYRLRVVRPDGREAAVVDPYVFLPTFTQFDEHLFGEGRHLRVYEKLGAHVREFGEVRGTSFAVWAPDADGVSVVGSFNDWDGRPHQMRRLGASGVWELFVPGVAAGALYKFEIHRRGLPLFMKADPYARAAEVPPATSSIVFESSYRFTDDEWIERRRTRDHLRSPMSIYEAHLGSWRRVLEEENRPFAYRETAPALADYLEREGFTHVEFLPLKGHPYGGSWGYQVANYYAPTARYGGPDDFRYLVDHLHTRGFSVVMDWVPAHFPKDAWSLGRFDGAPLYEHADPRRGEHPDWGTYIFDYGRNEVRNFLLANALFWIREFHLDALRVDAVASMLYLDYSRQDGRWLPNKFGGRENLEAIDFLRELNETVHAEHPGALMIAEESTAFPRVSHPVSEGGLGFDFKWNMGWMHDTLRYFQRDPLFRRFHHNDLTFGLVYAWSERFILPFSHDEVVHMKGSLLNKMSAQSAAEKFSTLRALYAHMWAHPGKQLLFMGGELAQWREWNDEQSLDWHLAAEPTHGGVGRLVAELNRIYRAEPALWEADHEPAGFEWIDADDADENVLAYLRVAPSAGRRLACVCNFSPVRREYLLALPAAGTYRVVLNTDDEQFGGSGASPCASVEAGAQPHRGRDFSALVQLPPLATLWLEVPREPATDADALSRARATGAASKKRAASAKAGATKKVGAAKAIKTSEKSSPTKKTAARKRPGRKPANKLDDDPLEETRESAAPCGPAIRRDSTDGEV